MIENAVFRNKRRMFFGDMNCPTQTFENWTDRQKEGQKRGGTDQ